MEIYLADCFVLYGENYQLISQNTELDPIKLKRLFLDFLRREIIIQQEKKIILNPLIKLDSNYLESEMLKEIPLMKKDNHLNFGLNQISLNDFELAWLKGQFLSIEHFIKNKKSLQSSLNKNQNNNLILFYGLTQKNKILNNLLIH